MAGRNAEIDPILQKADQLFEAGGVEDARKLYKQAVELVEQVGPFSLDGFFPRSTPQASLELAQTVFRYRMRGSAFSRDLNRLKRLEAMYVDVDYLIKTYLEPPDNMELDPINTNPQT